MYTEQYMKSLIRKKIDYLLALLCLGTFSVYTLNFGNSNIGYVDPNIYGGVAGNYKEFYDVFESSNSVMEKYSILRVVHISLLFLHQELFSELSIITFQIMFLLVNYIILTEILRLFYSLSSMFSFFITVWVLIIPTYILETRWNYVQVSGATFSLISIYFLLRFYKSYKSFNLIFYGISLALATNIHLKYTVLILTFNFFTLIFSKKILFKKITYSKDLFLTVLKGFFLGQLLIEVIFYLSLGRITTPIFIQTFFTPVKLAAMRIDGNQNIAGSAGDISIFDLFSFDYFYLFPIIFFAVVFNLKIIKVKAFSLGSDSVNQVTIWIAIALNSIILTFLLSLYVLELPIFEAYWYFNMIWPIYSVAQVLILALIAQKLNTQQKVIFSFLIGSTILILFFFHSIPKMNYTFILLCVIVLFGFVNNRRTYLITILTFGTLLLQFLQPPIGNKNNIDFQQYAARSQTQATRSLEFAQDQIWLSSLYASLHTKQNKSVPIWYSEKSGLGDMQSSTGFCVTALHDCGGSGEKPDLNIWLNNNGYVPEFIVIMDTMDQTSLRIARAELNNYGYSIIGLDMSPSLNFVVGIFESKG